MTGTTAYPDLTIVPTPTLTSSLTDLPLIPITRCTIARHVRMGIISMTRFTSVGSALWIIVDFVLSLECVILVRKATLFSSTDHLVPNPLRTAKFP